MQKVHSSSPAALLETFLRGTLGRTGPVALHEPWLKGNAQAYVQDCLDTGWVSSAGAYVTRFEEACAQACGTKHAVATVNGTTALQAALLSLGAGAGDAVLCPALCFVATANAIAHTGAVPLFVDSDPTTLGMNPTDVARVLDDDCERHDGALRHKHSGLRIAACVPMHVFGHPVDMDHILAACDTIPVVEDAAEALGSTYNGHPCGGLGLAGVLSFNGNKIITTGGGGMIVTDDGALAARARHLTTTARVGRGWNFDHDEVGYNYRLPNLNAALGCAQMEELPDLLARKRKLAGIYANLFGDAFVHGADFGVSNAWLNALVLADEAARDAFLEQTNARNIETRPAWRLLADLPMYGTAPRSGDLAVARDLTARLVNIPSSPNLMQAV